jgi:hypothetical protein
MAEKASAAYSRLRPAVARFGVTAWAVPFYSSRWNDLFLYGQVRGEARMMRGRLVPYLSLRFVGNAGGRHQERWWVSPQYLSETSVIGGAGLRWQIRYNLSAWAEAGESVSYTGRRDGAGLARPDYRAGASWLKGKGALLGSPEPGWFIETGLDPIYASRFDHDLFLYSQTRVGYTLRPGAGGWQVQLISHWNLTVDRLRYYWANLAEAGAGVRMKLPGAPRGATFRAEILRGAHLVNSGNPMGPNYWDFRSGVWYAFAH